MDGRRSQSSLRKGSIPHPTVSVSSLPLGGPPNPPPPQHQNVMSPSLERGPQPCACPWGPLGVAHAEPGEAHARPPPPPPPMRFAPPVPTGQGGTCSRQCLGQGCAATHPS